MDIRTTQKVYRIAWCVLGLGILIPLSVDNLLGIEIRGYTFRLNYFFHGLSIVAALLVALALKKEPGPSTATLIRDYFKSPYVLCILGMAVVGGISTFFVSKYFNRSLMYWIWSIGTLITVPLVVRHYWGGLGRWVPLALAAYVALQALVAIWDLFLCKAGLDTFTVGRINVGGWIGCRPQGWYQEPGYLAGFILLSAAWIRLYIHRTNNRFFWLFYVISLLGIVASTSKMGLLGVLWIVGFEGAMAVSSLKRKAWEISRRQWMLVGVGVGAFLLLLFVGGMQNLFPWITEWAARSGPNERWENARLSLKVFKEEPLFGAGPGAGGAYIAEQHADNRFFDAMKIAQSGWSFDREDFRRNPFSYSMPLEVLMEWGGLGFLFLALGLFFLLRRLPRWFFLYFSGILVCVFTTTQTLARYDIWVALSLVWVISEFCGRGKKCGTILETVGEDS